MSDRRRVFWRYGICAAASAAAFPLTVLALRQQALDIGYLPAQANFHGLIRGLEVALLWLPLVGVMFIDKPGAGCAEALAAAAGAAVAGAGLSLILAAPMAPLLGALGLILGVALVSLALGRPAFGLSVRLGRARATFVVLFLLSTPFWSARLLETITTSETTEATRRVLRQAAVWLAPGACLSAAYESNYFAHLPRAYNIWLGANAPYPDPWELNAGYGVAAAALFALAHLLARWRLQRRDHLWFAAAAGR